MTVTPVPGPTLLLAPRPWLPRWRTWHGRAAAALVGTLVVLALVAPGAAHPGPVAEVVTLAIGVAIFGVPHGALDPLVGRRWLAPRLGPRWWAPFHAAYVALVVAVLIGWTCAPAATLVAFLAASAVHFGLGDVARTRTPPRLAWLEVLARGAAPIAVPTAAHPDAVRQAFGWVAAGASPSALTTITAVLDTTARWIVVPVCAALALAHLVAASRASRGLPADAPASRRQAARRLATAHRTDACECLVVPALAAVLPPFVSFLVYFCLLHSARHALSLAAMLDAVSPRRAWAQFTRAALPATAMTLVLAVAAWLLVQRSALAGAAMAAVPAAVRVLFAGLAALTAPHMLLTALAGEPVGTGPRGRATPAVEPD